MIKPHKNRALGTVIRVQYFLKLNSQILIGSMISWSVKNSFFWLKWSICTARLSYWQYQLGSRLTGKSRRPKSSTWIQNYCCSHWNYRRITTLECCNNICSRCWAEYHTSVITKFKARKCKVSWNGKMQNKFPKNDKISIWSRNKLMILVRLV